MKMTIDYDLFKDKLNALSSEFFAVTDGKQALPILSIHQILRECEIGEYFPYKTAYFNGVRDGRATARPQGEWIDHSEEGYVECPFCEHLTNCEDNIDELHYC